VFRPAGAGTGEYNVGVAHAPHVVEGGCPFGIVLEAFCTDCYVVAVVCEVEVFPVSYEVYVSAGADIYAEVVAVVEEVSDCAVDVE